MRHRTAFFLHGFLLAAGVLTARSALADWPAAGHDARRSAKADGVSNIVTPAPFWRFRAGGGIGSSAVEPFDADGDGRPEMLLISGGRVVARQPDDNDVVWETPLLDNSLQMVGLANLDGAGEPELVVFSNSQVYVLSPSTGAIHWVEPQGEMGTIAAVRASDLDGDGADDLVIQECGCCAIMGPISGVAYRFAASLTAPEQAWISPPISCGAAPSFAVVHMRSPGESEAVIGTYTDLSLADGATGEVVGATGQLPYNAQAARCVGVDVRGDSAEELLCVRQSLGSGPPGSGHLLTLYRLASGVLEPNYEVSVGDVDGAVVVPAGAIADLDGDGTTEVLLAGRTAADTWITLVYDAATGEELASLPGHEVVGSVRARVTEGRRFVLTRVGDTLHAFTFASSALSEEFALPDRLPLEVVNRGLLNRTSINAEIVSVDLDGDGGFELPTLAISGGTDLVAYDLASGNPQVLLSYAPPASVEVLAAWPFDLGAYDSRMTIAQSDGNLHVLTTGWAPVSGNKEVGVRFGNYFSYASFRGLKLGPVAADLGDGGPPGLLVQTSRGSVDRLDARGATFAAGPSTVWSVPHTTGAVIAQGLDGGAPGIIAIDQESDVRHDIVGLSSAGERLWTAPLTGVTLTDLVVAQLDGDGVPDVVTEWGSPFDAVGEVRAIRGAGGGVLWDAPPHGPYNRQPSGGAAADWNGDGLDDFIYHSDGTLIRDGADGGLLASSTTGPNWSYYTPIVDDVNGDGEDDLTLTASYNPLATIDHDIDTVIWQGAEPDIPLPYGTIVRCDGRPPILVSGSWQTTAQLKLTDTSGATAGDFETLILAGGEAFDTVAQAEAAGADVGQLVSPVAHPELSPGAGDTVLVGSSDGWLYAVDPCQGTLVWSLFFNAPVGATALADVDGDGFDEILVSVADGFLYGVQHTPLPAPQTVFDIDPVHGHVGADIDEIVTDDTLFASWDAVELAASYQLAFIRDEVDGGGFLTDGWIDVGNETTASVAGLDLVIGKRYFAAVRAVTSDGRVSPDTLSDGVVVVETEKPPPPDDDGLGPPIRLDGRSCVYFCSAAPAGDTRFSLLIVSAGIALAFARRRTRR
jgi:outer membrane protein assembly factor BamB